MGLQNNSPEEEIEEKLNPIWKCGVRFLILSIML